MAGNDHSRYHSLLMALVVSIYPSRSSSPFPRGFEGPWFETFCAGLGVELVDVALPHRPALLFSFAMLARSGPLEICLLCTPALLPALDQMLAKASPLTFPPVLDFVAGLPRLAIDVG
jgi:hypothetical protein